MFNSIVNVLGGILCWYAIGAFVWLCLLKPVLRPVGGLFGYFSDRGSKSGLALGNLDEPKTEGKKLEKAEKPKEVTEGTKFFESIMPMPHDSAVWVRSCPVSKIGYVSLRAYADHMERCLIITDSVTLAKKMGRRVNLEPLNGFFTIDNKTVDVSTIDEVRRLVEPHISKLESSKPAKPKPSKSEVTSVQDTTVEPKVEVAPEKVKKVEAEPTKKPKPLEIYKGILVDYGKALRNLSKSSSDSNSDGGTIEQFRVVIRTDDGNEESVWGQDLLRALNDANIDVGDTIEVTKTGKRQVGNSWKNLYQIKKLA